VDVEAESFSIDTGEKKSVPLEMETASSTETCRGVITFEQGERVVGFSPVQLSIHRGKKSRFNLLPMIVVVWAMVTLYEVFIRG
ncbi:MAG: hypothetical protein SVS85_00515, partial [Candidatus Nanohaloarchaea archaeon]|nr:hypothetical protein [Candidatus Nanohaloarchaea archaeon]